MDQAAPPDRALARRLRALRTEQWPPTRVTQHQIAEAFGGDKPLSESLISSWESPRGDAQPPDTRLHSYATFFASQRSIEGRRPRLLSDAVLTEDERTTRDRLYEELSRLRIPDNVEPAEAINARRLPLATTPDAIGGGTWFFADRRPVTIVCAKLPAELLAHMPYTKAEDPDYVRLYTYADLDALVELFGHIRAVNPTIEVNFKLAGELATDDYTNHLVLLGGVDWNLVTRDLSRRLHLPVRQRSRPDDEEYNGYYVLGDGDNQQAFEPTMDRQTTPPRLLEDVAFFFRAPNPYNTRRTVTMCNGMFGRGTYGAVRALTDAKFRDRNEKYVKVRFAGRPAFGILHRVIISVTGEALTPDWSESGSRLYEWPEALR